MRTGLHLREQSPFALTGLCWYLRTSLLHRNEVEEVPDDLEWGSQEDQSSPIPHSLATNLKETEKLGVNG